MSSTCLPGSPVLGLGGLSPGAQCPWSWEVGGGGFQEAVGLGTTNPGLAPSSRGAHPLTQLWLCLAEGPTLLPNAGAQPPTLWIDGLSLCLEVVRPPSSHKVALPWASKALSWSCPLSLQLGPGRDHACWGGGRLRSPGDHGGGPSAASQPGMTPGLGLPWDRDKAILTCPGSPPPALWSPA